MIDELLKSVESHQLEFKDFSKTPDTESCIKDLKSKVFKEISAMANSDGGTIIIGIDDETKEKIPQPSHILKLLQNESLGRFINDYSDNFINVSSEEHDKLIIIKTPPSKVLIAASKDLKGINKGEVFIRENAEAKKATAKHLYQLHQKFSKIPISEKIKILSKIVKQKFENGQNTDFHLNIFDTLVITISNTELAKELETQFDFNMYFQFLLSFNLPLSKHTTQFMYNHTMASIIESSKLGNVNFNRNRDILKMLKESKCTLQPLIEGWRELAYNSESFNNYIKEYSFD